MNRMTIDFGIDLGTTNSAIAVFDGNGAKVIRCNEGLENLPSAIWVDRHNGIHVGNEARSRIKDDPENTAVEFKRRMGKIAPTVFPRAGREMTPEELSAEVLKALRSDALQVTGDEVRAAVIGVPASFDANQSRATVTAAQLAGLETVKLLQEPIAAALAYGFDVDENDKAYWLVYDLGGGTFDAAIVQLRDGEFTIIKDGGHPLLGGKDLDWEIVDTLLIPAVMASAPLKDLRRGNPKWAATIAKLKSAAEEAKIRCSRSNTSSTEILIDNLCVDDEGHDVDFAFTLKRDDLALLAAPFIRRTVDLCRDVLAASGLSSEDIEKTILVGGPTLAPYLRDIVKDPVEGLGIPLEFGIDPMTVVARGAAIFAGAQRLDLAVTPTEPDAFTLDLEYEPIGPDTQPLFGGLVRSGDKDQNFDGFTIECVNAGTGWRSGRVPVGPQGFFQLTLLAERGSRNEFEISVRDGSGSLVSVEPSLITYTVGAVHTSPSLSHSIGVALADGTTEWFVEKGATLPANRSMVLRTAWAVEKGRSRDVIRIPVVEGFSSRSDRNRTVGKLEISAHQVSASVPVGSEVRVTIDIDTSRAISAQAFIPMLEDDPVKEVIKTPSQPIPDHSTLKKSVRSLHGRIDEVREKTTSGDGESARRLLEQIDSEDWMNELDKDLAASDGDADAAQSCERRCIDLSAMLDEAEAMIDEWPKLVEDAQKALSLARQLVDEIGRSSDRELLTLKERHVSEAIEVRDASLLEQRSEEVHMLIMDLADRSGVLPVQNFADLCDRRERGEFSDPSLADPLLDRGRRALREEDLDTLRSINGQLRAMLRPDIPYDESTVIRG